MSLSFRYKNCITGYLFILPPLLGALILYVYPLLACIFNGFFQWNAINPRKFIGIENFYWLFVKDNQVKTSIMATLIYLAFHIPALVGGGFFLAVLLNSPRLHGAGSLSERLPYRWLLRVSFSY